MGCVMALVALVRLCGRVWRFMRIVGCVVRVVGGVRQWYSVWSLWCGHVRRRLCVFIPHRGSASSRLDVLPFAPWVPLLASLRVWSSVVVSASVCAERTPRPVCRARSVCVRLRSRVVCMMWCRLSCCAVLCASCGGIAPAVGLEWRRVAFRALRSWWWWWWWCGV